MERINQKTTKQIKRENKNWLLLVTVNDIETNSLLSRLKPLKDYSDILVAYSKNNTYFIGRFGAYNVIHVQSDMGAMNRDAVMTTVDNAIKMWKPRGIIMVGVAWGMNKGKQRIGDVLISKKILQYETAKISNGSTIPRGADTEAGGVLTNRFKSCMDWEYLLEDGKAAKKYMGTVLSGEKLLDDKNYRDKLHSSFPEAIGGEMEGAGLASVAMANNLYEWIIVKGICDWGYDKQSENKDRYQEIAMESAISLCESVLCDDSVLEEILKAEKRKNNADNLMLRINAYKLFFYRNSQKITIKELSKLSGISIGHISKCEKINAEENEFSIRIFRETTVATIRSLEKALNLRKGELIADDDDLLAEKYKNYYLKKKGIHDTPMKLKNAKIVVFDFDGTLVSPNFSKTTWERIWTELGYSVNDCDYYHRQFSNKQITHEQWCKITEDKFREAGLTKEIMKKIASEMVLIDGCKETLMELKSRDVLLYIVSGSIREIIKEVLGDMVNLFEDISANKFYFQKGKLSRIVGTEYDFEGKAEYVKQIVNENKINASEILFVGNSFNDTFVHLSGARTLCINPQNTNYTNSIYWHDYIREVNNLREILPHVFIEDK